jgi:hypothetical protein
MVEVDMGMVVVLDRMVVTVAAATVAATTVEAAMVEAVMVEPATAAVTGAVVAVAVMAMGIIRAQVVMVAVTVGVAGARQPTSPATLATSGPERRRKPQTQRAGLFAS